MFFSYLQNYKKSQLLIMMTNNVINVFVFVIFRTLLCILITQTLLNISRYISLCLKSYTL